MTVASDDEAPLALLQNARDQLAQKVIEINRNNIGRGSRNIYQGKQLQLLEFLSRHRPTWV